MYGYDRVPEVILDPGARYADDSLRMFQGIPTLERANSGRLWAAWYGGGFTEDRHNYVMLVSSDDDGASWSPLKLVVDPDGPGLARAFDPCLWCDPDDRLWLFWAQSVELKTPEAIKHCVWEMHTNEGDRADATWSAPRMIADGLMLNKPTVLSSGAWLMCNADWHAEGSARVFRSDNAGASWGMIGRAFVPRAMRAYDETMVVERRDGSLWMLIRVQDGIAECTSTDGGRTWSSVEPSAIAHVCSRFFLRRLRSGALLLVKHGTTVGERPEQRSHLSAFLSPDDGKTWEGGLLLDEREDVSYPDGTESEDGTLYIIHDYSRQVEKEILMSRITEADIRAGRLCAERSRLRMLINKATGRNLAFADQTPMHEA